VVSGRGMPRGDLITMCHVVVCDPPSDNESGRDPCLSNGGSPPATCRQPGTAERTCLEVDS
jgi:hypothetical protein